MTLLLKLYFLHGSLAARDYDMPKVYMGEKEEILRTINY